MGSSASAPAPDPELERAQIASMRHGLRIGQRQQEMAEELLPTQREALKFGMESSREAYRQTQEDRAYALEKRGQYDKALGGLVNEASKFNEAARANELGQQVSADVRSAFSQAQAQRKRQMGSYNPLSGKIVLGEQAGELAEAKALADARRMVGEQARAEGLGVSKGVAALLSDAPATAASLSPSSARLGWGVVDLANAGVAGMNQQFSQGADLWGAAGKNAGDMYNNQSRIWSDANVANIKSRGEMAGIIAGGASSAIGAKGGDWLASANEKFNPNFMGPPRA